MSEHDDEWVDPTDTAILRFLIPDEVPQWVECDCDPDDPCGYCAPDA